MVFPPLSNAVRAQGPAALPASSAPRPKARWKASVVTARRAKSIVQVSVTTDAEGRYSFPRDRLEPGDYTLDIRAVGYDIDSPAKAAVANGKAATADIKLKKTKNLAGQLSNAEWMMSFPGTEDQKAELLNCVGCHTLERVARSTHDADEWTHVISRMRGYGAVSQPIKPQRMLDANRAGTPEQFRKAAEYLATIKPERRRPLGVRIEDAGASQGPRHPRHRHAVRHGSADDRAPRRAGRQGRQVWYTDFGEMFIGKFDPKSLKLVEYPIKKFKDKAPTGLLSIEFDHEGKIWFDTMYQAAMGRLDPKTGKIDYYPVAKEWNDDTVQLNFSGLRHDVDGKVWTKTVARSTSSALDIKTGTWERFHPTDSLPADRSRAPASIKSSRTRRTTCGWPNSPGAISARSTPRPRR